MVENLGLNGKTLNTNPYLDLDLHNKHKFSPIRSKILSWRSHQHTCAGLFIENIYRYIKVPEKRLSTRILWLLLVYLDYFILNLMPGQTTHQLDSKASAGSELHP